MSEILGEVQYNLVLVFFGWYWNKIWYQFLIRKTLLLIITVIRCHRQQNYEYLKPPDTAHLDRMLPIPSKILWFNFIQNSLAINQEADCASDYPPPSDHQDLEPIRPPCQPTVVANLSTAAPKMKLARAKTGWADQSGWWLTGYESACWLAGRQRLHASKVDGRLLSHMPVWKMAPANSLGRSGNK